MSETEPPYRPSDPYEWGLQGTRPAAVEHHDSEPFQAPRVPKEDDPEDFDQPPPPAPEPREWVMEGYLPMLWRELAAGAKRGKNDVIRLTTRRKNHVQDVQEQPERAASLGQVEERDAPEHGPGARPGESPGVPL